MRIYLDLCCFNRPFDDQAQARIRLETEAKIILQQKVKDAECELIWSSILDFECSMNPFEDRRIAILNWRNVACDTIMADEPVLEQAQRLLEYRIGTYDALHAACAIVGKADVFVTTDDHLLKHLRSAGGIAAMLPQDALAFVEGWYEN